MRKLPNYEDMNKNENRILSAVKNRLVKDYGYPVSLIEENYSLTKAGHQADLVVFDSAKKDKILIVVEAKSEDFIVTLGLAQLEKNMKLSNAKYGILTNSIEYIFLENIDGEFIQFADIPKKKKSDKKTELKLIPNPSNLIWQFFNQSRDFYYPLNEFDYELLKIIVSKFVDENDPKSKNHMKEFLTNDDHENYLLLQDLWTFTKERYPILKDEEVRIDPKFATLLIHSLKDFSVSKSNLHEIISTILSYGSKQTRGFTDPHQEIIDLMLEFANIHSKDSILIPFCGSGNILLSLEKYISFNEKNINSKIIFVENNQRIANQCNMIMILLGMKPSVICEDPIYFENENQFDKILCFNVPFGRKIKPNPYPIGSDYEDNLIFKLSGNVKLGGKIVALLPSNFLFKTNKSKQRLREILLKEFYLHAVIEPPQGVFYPSAMVNTAIVVLEKKSPKPEISVKNENYDIFFGKLDGKYSKDVSTNETQIKKLLSEYKIFRQNNTLKNPSSLGFLSSPDNLQEHWNLRFGLELKEKISAIENAVKLSEIAEIIPGKSILDKSTIGNEVPYLRISDLQDKLIQDDISKKVHLSDSILKKLTPQRILRDDIIISRQATIGKTAIVTSKHEGSLLSPQLVALRPTKKILPEYLLHVLSLDSTQEQLTQLTRGSFIKALPSKSLKNLVIPLPSISEQEKTVKKFMKIVDKIQLLEEELSSLKSELTKTGVGE